LEIVWHLKKNTKRNGLHLFKCGIVGDFLAIPNTIDWCLSKPFLECGILTISMPIKNSLLSLNL